MQEIKNKEYREIFSTGASMTILLNKDVKDIKKNPGYTFIVGKGNSQ